MARLGLAVAHQVTPLVTTRRKEKVVLALDGQVIDQALEEIQKADEERARKAREAAKRRRGGREHA